MSKKKDIEAASRLKETLADCWENGFATVEIRWIGGGPTSTGRSDYYEIRVWRTAEGRPYPAEWLTRNYCFATGSRFNKSREAVLVSGCGFSKAHQIAQELAAIAGHPIQVCTPGDFAGRGGLVKP